MPANRVAGLVQIGERAAPAFFFNPLLVILSMRRILIFTVLLSLALYGCVLNAPNPVPGPANETPVSPVTPVKSPTFTIATPFAGQTITVSEVPTDVELNFTTTNLILKTPGGVAKTGEGHFRVTIDNGQPITVTQKTYAMSGLDIGEHTVKVELLNNDNKPYLGQTRQISFTIRKEEPLVYEPKNYDVVIKNGKYEPSQLNVHVSDTVTFVNQDAMPSSAQAVVNGVTIFDTKMLANGQTATVVVNTPGTFDFYSPTSPTLRGKITVTD